MLSPRNEQILKAVTIAAVISGLTLAVVFFSLTVAYHHNSDLLFEVTAGFTLQMPEAAPDYLIQRMPHGFLSVGYVLSFMALIAVFMPIINLIFWKPYTTRLRSSMQGITLFYGLVLSLGTMVAIAICGNPHLESIIPSIFSVFLGTLCMEVPIYIKSLENTYLVWRYKHRSELLFPLTFILIGTLCIIFPWILIMSNIVMIISNGKKVYPFLPWLGFLGVIVHTGYIIAPIMAFSGRVRTYIVEIVYIFQILLLCGINGAIIFSGLISFNAVNIASSYEAFCNRTL